MIVADSDVLAAMTILPIVSREVKAAARFARLCYPTPMKATLRLLFAATLALPNTALAFCRTTTCAQTLPPDECIPGQIVSSCQLAGLPLYWPKPCVSFSVQVDGSKNSGITADQFEAVVRTAFDNWQNASCANGGTPNMSVVTYPKVECDVAGYNPGGPNQNVWMFHDDGWPYDGAGSDTPARTTLSFNAKSGEIYDIDVELNAYRYIFSLDATSLGATVDLQSIVQHEAGHFLGLAHSSDAAATMWANYAGGIDARTLESDDVSGICAAYPPVATADAGCDPEPRSGFATTCTLAAAGGTGGAASASGGSQTTGGNAVVGTGGAMAIPHDTGGASGIALSTAEPDPTGGCTCTLAGARHSGTTRGVSWLCAVLGLALLRARRINALRPGARHDSSF